MHSNNIGTHKNFNNMHLFHGNFPSIFIQHLNIQNIYNTIFIKKKII